MQIPNTLFSENKRKELCIGKNITLKQKKAIKEWKERLDNNTFQGESHYKDYLRDLMIDGLGYPRDKIKAEEGKKNTRMDYSYVPPSGKGGILFELKDRKKMPFEDQDYDNPDQKTPVKQALTYITKNPNIDFAIVTNFEEFVLVTRFDFEEQCYHFKFPPNGTKLLDSEILQFASIFSKESVDSGFINELKHETIVEGKNLSDDFYKLYHQTRLLLIQAFTEKNNIDHDDAIKIAQTYLNRLIFLFFAEDTGLVKKDVFSEGVLSLLDSGDIKDGTTKVSDHIQTIFSWMNEGSHEIDHKLGFNGEFFKEPIDRNAFFYDFKKFDDIITKVKLPKNVKLNEEYQKSVNRYDGKISPIITNLLIMNSYKFGGESTTGDYISVNILGHIFEQSIGDLEELHNKEISQRKTDGVYYTPDYITTYICKNTIIPYLSKKNSTESHQLVREYTDDITKLEEKLEQIKILDPACGSGAFLVKAVDILISIYDEIQNFKESQGAYVVTKKGKKSGSSKVETFDKKIEMEHMRGIIQNNIYGVDINPESIEITKLSLFLKIASKNKRLIGLEDRIKIGNSLIDDRTIDPKAFDWKKAFAEILDDNILDNGFDVIIGNPPWVFGGNVGISKKEKEYFKKKYSFATKKLNLFSLFIGKSLSIIKESGFLGFITPNTLLRVTSYEDIRKLILNKTLIQEIINLQPGVFEGVTASTIMLLLQKEKDVKKLQKHKIMIFEGVNGNKMEKGQQEFYGGLHIFDLGSTGKSYETLEKMKIDTVTLGSISKEMIFGVVITKNKDEVVSDTKKNEKYKPFLEGKDIGNYQINFANKFLLYEKSKLHRSRTPEIFETKEKLLVQRISGGTKPLKVAYDNQQYYNKESINNIIIGDKKYDPKYILTLLNSNLINWYYSSKFTNASKLTVNVSKAYLSQIPIKPISINEQKPLIDNANNILNLKGDKTEIIRKFKDRISQNLELKKFTKKLVNFHELIFEEFFEELKKQNITLTLKQQEEWEEYFIDKKNIILKNIEKTNQLELDINSIIYKLYCLNQDEIKIVESEIE